MVLEIDCEKDDSISKISEVDMWLFSGSRCAELAQALHLATGWSIVVVDDGVDGVVGWVHAGVETPAGKFLDVEGVHEVEEWLERWGPIMDEYGKALPAYDEEAVQISAGSNWGLPDWESYPVSDEDQVTLLRVAHALLTGLC